MLISKIREELETGRLVGKGDRVLCAVSGGPDSTALLQVMWELREEGGFSVGAVHVNHRLRGEESEEDARFVKRFCLERKIPVIVLQADVAGELKARGGNRQDVARKWRYRLFREAAKRWNANVLALAHHADDQAETVLMRMLRGAGPGGLTGMEKVRRWKGIRLIRPLLGCSKEELEAFCRERNIRPRLDSSNESLVYTRNYVRHKIMPVLESVNPRVKRALNQLADILREEERVWKDLTEDAVRKVCLRRERDVWELDVSSFLHLPVALQRRMVKLILSYLSDAENPDWTLDAVERARNLALGDNPSARADLPGGILACREYGLMRLTRRGGNQETAVEHGPASVRIPLVIPGMTPLSGLSGAIRASVKEGSWHGQVDGRDKAVFDRDALEGPLVVRSRKPGDRMTVLGMNGTKKLKDVFMEAKIPKRLRDRHPVVECGGEILWLPGIRRSALAPVTSATRRFLCLEWVREEDPSVPQKLSQIQEDCHASGHQTDLDHGRGDCPEDGGVGQSDRR
ncbi:tRNA lysidine(34) synthetase TilS [Staphylospora marina]|uniref:tRNA lysidine(34) synthetase TilS n=1 Tax=Staphylospora marina TaxID=2490858 RepID=UPI000F5BE86B|nr:tRNA lysidine(34) synthetase TilS [Staphylospora marina]